ncbi:hypothetical protein EON67_10500 [archaeon]|nr:MAG: hypothetical protein EON67_10500 [archaeon]
MFARECLAVCARLATEQTNWSSTTTHNGNNKFPKQAAHAQTHTHACTRTLAAAPPHTSTHIARTHARTHARSPPPAPRSAFVSLSLTAPPSTATLPCVP